MKNFCFIYIYNRKFKKLIEYLKHSDVSINIKYKRNFGISYYMHNMSVLKTL